MPAHTDRWDRPRHGERCKPAAIPDRDPGRLSDRLGSAFAEMSLERHPGQTVMSGPADQARLHVLLDRLRDLGIEPVSVDVDE
jgi:hypothetical protein